MYNLSDTIVAIATPHGTGSIAAIRISGAESWNIISKIFRATGKDHGLTHMNAVHGFIHDKNKIIDEVIILPYKSPKSFTTEDVIEIFCHGGIHIPSITLELCILNGARRAKKGEFTFRAFVNGRIDLTEAEAINEIINAETKKNIFASSNALTGSLKKKVFDFKERIFNLVTSIESAIEFPMDVSSKNKTELSSSLSEIEDEIKKLISLSHDGQVFRQGMKVSIIGAPNVGKSSLLNQLLENERAIVTDIPGTTRDIIEEKLFINDFPIVIIDTAGIREHRAEIKELSLPESIGIEKTKQVIEKSDLVLFVKDLSIKENSKEKEIETLLNKKLKLVVGNKSDLVNGHKNNCDIAVSAKLGTNLDLLKKMIVEKIKITGIKEEENLIYVNERQRELILQCLNSINFAIETLNKNLPEDLIADELKKAISKLDEVSGQKINDDVMKSIFEKFCIGK